jgi:hypothetical protein
MPEIPYSIRDRHVHVIGKSGYGKSTLLAWWAYNDIIHNQGGVCVIDPKGDLVERILRVIPEERKKDCIWIDIDDPLPLDFMSCEKGKEESVVADLKFILMSGMIDTSNMPNINDNVEALLYTLLEANSNPEMPRDERCTFLDISDFLENKERQKFILSYVTNPRNKRFWDVELNNNDKKRITSRINPFIRNATLSKVFGDPNPRLNMHDVINQNKILLVRVPVLNPSSATYGALLVSKLQQAAFIPSRLADDAKPFFLYIDEFQNFRATEAYEKVLEMARGYKLCLTLANLKLDHDLDDRVISALGIISSYILFQIYAKDAAFYKPIIEDEDPARNIREMYEKEALRWKLTAWEHETDSQRYRLEKLREMANNLPPPPVTIQDALKLERFQAIYKIDNEPAIIEDTPTPMSKFPTPEQQKKMDEIKAASKERYSSSAESGQNRSEDKAPCNPPEIRQDVRNEHRVTSAEKPEVQPGSAPSNIPPHENKT